MPARVFKCGRIVWQGGKSVKASSKVVSAEAPLLSEQEIASARKLYVNKCAQCHKFHNPAKYADEEWHTWMRKMSRKAKLKPEQEELLSRYLGLFRTSVGTNAGAASGAVK